MNNPSTTKAPLADYLAHLPLAEEERERLGESASFSELHARLAGAEGAAADAELELRLRRGGSGKRQGENAERGRESRQEGAPGEGCSRHGTSPGRSGSARREGREDAV